MDFFNPLDDKHFYINLGYIINSLVCFASFKYSFKNNDVKFHLIPMLLITSQQEIRMVDYENTERLFKDSPIAFDFFLVSISCSICVLLLMIS